MAERTRSFLALTLPREALRAAETVLAELRGRLGAGPVKWVAPENLHITLRFLGDLDARELERVRDLTHSLDGTFTPLPTTWRELGTFPSPRRPHVIWLGLADEAGELRSLAAEVNERLLRAGFGRADKPFAAHVTLGRVREGRRVDWAAASERLTSPPAAFSIQTIVLFKSRLTPAGAEYTPLETATARNATSGGSPESGGKAQ
jgi:2'-5' RNA ligase